MCAVFNLPVTYTTNTSRRPGRVSASFLEPTTDSNRTDACVQIKCKECGVSLPIYIYMNKLYVIFAV